MLEVVTTLAENVESWILAFAASPWIYLVLFGLTAIDGFFPPVPSESVIITLAVAAHAHGTPNLWIVLLVSAIAAWSGDQAAYHIGRWIGTDRVWFLRTRRGEAAVAWARRALGRRGASFILAARYIPIGRVAVNMTAGAVGYKRERFMVVSALAAVLWSGYSVGIGLAAASWLGHNTLLAMAVGIVFGVLAGVVLDRVMSRVALRRDARADAEGAASAAADRGGADPELPGPATPGRPSAESVVV